MSRVPAGGKSGRGRTIAERHKAIWEAVATERDTLREALELATATLELFCPSGARSQPKFWQQFTPGSVKEQVVADYCRGVLNGASQAVHAAARAVEGAGVGGSPSDGPKASQSCAVDSSGRCIHPRHDHGAVLRGKP